MVERAYFKWKEQMVYEWCQESARSSRKTMRGARNATGSLKPLSRLLVGISVACLAGSLSCATEAEVESVCFGSPARGRLQGGVRLPRDGPNFSAYSDVGSTLGRTYVHGRVREVVAAAYEVLRDSQPNQHFVYGETGWEEGGSFKPHRTHQNGLSVDFMVPVVDQDGAPTELPTHALNKWGYGLEFDAQGVGDDLQIDFEAVAAHLAALREAARSQGVGIAKVIFAPDLRKRLRGTKAWPKIRDLPFTKRPVWVRHDDHYHVDFKVECRSQP